MRYPLAVRLMAGTPEYRAKAKELVSDRSKMRELADEFLRLDLYPNFFYPPLRCRETIGEVFAARALAFVDYVKREGVQS